MTDTGGIDDRSFNATAWKGVQDAMDELGVEGDYLESQHETDYEKNIDAFIEDGCDLIVAVGSCWEMRRGRRPKRTRSKSFRSWTSPMTRRLTTSWGRSSTRRRRHSWQDMLRLR